MRLNTIKAAENSRPSRRRVGRGIGSGLGKTGGRGHKGQKSRSGGYHKMGFEGGQMPIQRRLPKVGFKSWRQRVTTEITLDILNKFDKTVELLSLREAGIINGKIQFVKVIKTGKLDKAVTIKGLSVTKGAQAAIEAAGGKVEE